MIFRQSGILAAALALTLGIAACGGKTEPAREATVHPDSAPAAAASLSEFEGQLARGADETYTSAHPVLEDVAAHAVSASELPGPLSSLDGHSIDHAGAELLDELLQVDPDNVPPATIAPVLPPPRRLLANWQSTTGQARQTHKPMDLSISGTVIEAEGDRLTVMTQISERELKVAPDARVLKPTSGSLSDVVAGLATSVVKLPDGSARVLHLYPPGLPVPEQGMTPLTGTEQGSVRLTGDIIGVYPRSIVVAAAGQMFPLALGPQTRVTKPTAAAITDITVGQQVGVRAYQQTNGETTAMAIYLLDEALATVPRPTAPAAPSPMAR